MATCAKIIIYTDLDGTFLDHETYSYAESLPALQAATAKAIPIVFCSSKTRAEIEIIRQCTSVLDPFIVENGGAVYVPVDYFPFFIDGSMRRGEFEVIELGIPYSQLMETLQRLRQDIRRQIVGFNDMTVEEVAGYCGLTWTEARRAKDREYDEAFEIIDADPHIVQIVLQKIEETGLRYTIGGRYYHLLGENDKGRAIKILNELFKKAYGSIFTVGLGDSLNDLPMLDAVDHPVLVKKLDGHHDRTVIERLPRIHLVNGIGPHGWNTAVMMILAEAGYV
jgi:mannosyl-3-phosphoglycerate phosphatase